MSHTAIVERSMGSLGQNMSSPQRVPSNRPSSARASMAGLCTPAVTSENRSCWAATVAGAAKTDAITAAAAKHLTGHADQAALSLRPTMPEKAKGAYAARWTHRQVEFAHP